MKNVDKDIEKVLVSSEEIEAITPADILRRMDINAVLVGVSSKQVTGAHGFEITADMTLNRAAKTLPDGVILPGGMPGTTNLMSNQTVNTFVDYCAENGLLLSAICAAPMILGRKGLLDGCKAICFPGFENELIGATISDEFICTDKNIITAKGMGSAVNFGIEIALNCE